MLRTFRNLIALLYRKGVNYGKSRLKTHASDTDVVTAPNEQKQYFI